MDLADPGQAVREHRAEVRAVRPVDDADAAPREAPRRDLGAPRIRPGGALVIHV